MSRCIDCYRCVRICDEVQGQMVLSMHGRGFAARIIKGLDTSFENSPCVSCGACSQACPTSAISDIFASKSIEATKKNFEAVFHSIPFGYDRTAPTGVALSEIDENRG